MPLLTLALKNCKHKQSWASTKCFQKLFWFSKTLLVQVFESTKTQQERKLSCQNTQAFRWTCSEVPYISKQSRAGTCKLCHFFFVSSTLYRAAPDIPAIFIIENNTKVSGNHTLEHIRSAAQPYSRTSFKKVRAKLRSSFFFEGHGTTLKVHDDKECL